MKKGIKITVLAFLLVFALIACGEVSSTTTTTSNDSTSSAVTDQLPALSGVEDKTVTHNDSSFELLDGISASDNEDGDLTASITYVSDFDIAVIGEYEVTVSVTDSADQTTTATFTVTVEPTADEAVAMSDLDLISLDIDNLVLPSSGSGGSTIYWQTDRPDVITKKGFIMKPGIGSDPVTVTLTATAIKNKARITKDFELVVQPNVELNGVTSSVTVAFTGTSTEYVVPDNPAVDLYFVDNGNLPYIDVETFLNLINGALDSSIITVTPEGDDQLRISYSVEYEDFDGSTVNQDYWALIDFTENTFTVNNYDFFEGYIAETTSDYGEGLNYVDADYVDGSETTIPLGFYNFDILIYEDGGNTYYLLPLHVADLLFAGDVYYDVYYNGDQLYGIDTFLLYSDEESDAELLETIRTSSFNSLSAPLDVRWATYNFMALTMDYFYGLRDMYDVDTMYEVLSQYAQDLVTGTTDTSLYHGVFDIAYGMDDLHTSYGFTGYYEAPYDITLYQNDLGAGTLAFYNGLWDMQDLLTAKFGSYDSLPQYRLLDDVTAIIYLTEFTIDTPDAFKAIIDNLPATIENVVIDLSYNTGGNVGAVLRIFGYMTENAIEYHSMNPADGAMVTYYIESDYVAYDYDWYINTSSVTFSAANLMASIAKEQGIATIIGKNSSGGASSVGAVFSPDGSCVIISTNNVLTTKVSDGEGGYIFVSVEDGIPVDIQLYNPTSDSLILGAIAQHQAEVGE